MATDYDAPRQGEDDLAVESVEQLRPPGGTDSEALEEDEALAAESFELPGADLSGEELTVRVLPQQQDEFTCSRCFLVKHRSQLARTEDGQPVCSECAAELV